MKRITLALRRLVAACASVLVALALVPTSAWAADRRVVTLGADLTADQRTQVLSFFGLKEADLANLKVITVTNADERARLAGALDANIIGDKTYSCSYIQPTDSGGIYVQTANLNYVTNLTLYNALQTAGVKNCNLVVTAPFEVTGTGALTGVFMAFESQGVVLDEQKKTVATEELVETAQMEKTYGEGVAELISDAKNQVVAATENLTDDQIREIIRTAAASRGITLSDEDLNRIVQLLNQLKALNYDADAFAATLSDFQKKLEEVTRQVGGAGGILEAIGNFFKGIADWFAGLFNGGQTTANGVAQSAQEFFNSFNTNVFQWDTKN